MATTIDPATLDALREKHGELHELPLGEGEAVLVRRPRRADYKKFRGKADREATRADALEILARDCIVWPDVAAFEAMLERRPALADVVGGKLLELAGLSEDPDTKKL